MSDRSDGFTLIETLVALVIFAGIFAALSAGFSSGTRGLRVAQADQRALMLAKAKLATTGLESRLADGLQETGDEDGFTWRVDVQQRIAEEGEIKDAGQKAFWVMVKVTWHDGALGKLRTTELKGLKLSTAP